MGSFFVCRLGEHNIHLLPRTRNSRLPKTTDAN